MLSASGFPWHLRSLQVFLLPALLALNGSAQIITNHVIPVVTIRATDPLGSWSGDAGVFTVSRDGATNEALNVYYAIGGTASNGVDYALITHFVSIPAGLRTNSITIAPITNGQTNTETVELKLVYSPLMPPVNYAIGYPASATVFITPAGVSNIPPSVALTSPPEGSVFKTPGVVPLIALGSDPDGVVVSMEFFADDTSLGIVTNWVVVDPPGPGGNFIPGTRAFFFTWTNPLAGVYALSARAKDDGGSSTGSKPVHIIVQAGASPTNHPPLVRITSPPNGALFRSPIKIPIYAYAHDLDGFVTNVELFAGTNDLGSGQGLCTEARPGSNWPPLCATNFFFLVWSNPSPGTYSLRAVASDNDGAASSSEPVNIVVAPAPPPPTNRPPSVSIFATDPLAIEGTNCWPWLGLGSIRPTWSNWISGVATWRFFTNCGPKNASFSIRRFGDTNEDLTVFYSVGGSATNGIDYVPLSGTVVIPAGDRLAEVAVVPLDDGPPDINSTVVLKLLPSTNYFLGVPRSAAALILDTGAPHPKVEMLPDSSFHLSSTGPDGAWFRVEYSRDLSNWASICTNQVVNGLIEFVDPETGTNYVGFYRTVPEIAPPGN